MKRIFTQLSMLSFLLWMSSQLLIAQERLIVEGQVRDFETNEPLTGANIVEQGSGKGTVSDVNGFFSLEVEKAETTLRITMIGYEAQRLRVNAPTKVEVMMESGILMGDELVISASRKPERLTEAPAAISVISSKDLEQMPTYNIGEFLKKVQGVEVVRSGVLGVGINARGFNNAFNVRMLQLNDGRNGMLPGGTGLPAGIYNTIIKEDIERVEIILGPTSALYGPNAHAGVVNTITKDPRTSEGTTIVVGGGNQNQFTTRLRHANALENSKFAYKVNFEYTSGTDFEFVDSVYVNNVAFPELEPDFDFEIIRANAAVYYEVGKNADIILDYGYGQGSNIGVTNAGRNQIGGWNFQYLNARFVSENWFVNVYNTWNDAGNTFQINGRTANYANLLGMGVEEQEARRLSLLPVEEGGLGFPGFRDESYRFNAEVQYNNTFGDDWRIVSALSMQHDHANSFGTYLFDFNGEQPITINQYGGVVQVEKPFANIFKFTGAARLDYHDLFEFQFSPRAALTANALGGTFRTTFSRAFSAPPIQFLEFGFPFAGGGIVGSGRGLGLREFSLNPLTGEFIPSAQTREIQPLQPEDVQTWEAGYKGSITKNIFVEATGWVSNSTNFISPAISLFGFSPASGLIEGEFIETRGDEALPTDPNFGLLHLTYLNYGQVRAYGADIGVNVILNKYLSMGAKYMWFGSDITQEGKFDNEPNLQNLPQATRESLAVLNAPEHRANFNLTASNLLDGKLFASLTLRWVPEYDFISGQQRATAEGAGTRAPGFNFDRGPLGGFTTTGLSAGYRITDNFMLGGSVENLFDVDQVEFVASPRIGRLINLELKIDF
ncbi:MAG: TonB-dependent receptor [Cyclobacteriaceae bacterium]|nr:TonB-dependent receptor [Cyclobacteriaceae bacterium]MCH8517728.1 TonB-dependent receptor [Cyclobacteriaceae bacterium]